MYIKNIEELLLADCHSLKEVGLRIINSALIAADPYRATKALIHLDGDILNIGSLQCDLSKKKNIYVLGGGKAVYPVAKALEEILQEKITEGLIIVKEGHQGILDKIKIREAAHPIPDQKGFKAAKEIKTIAEKSKGAPRIFLSRIRAVF